MTSTTAAGQAQMTFLMTVTAADGTVTRGACADADVMRAMATAARRGYAVEVSCRGRVCITREIPGKGSREVIYVPVREVGHLTATSVKDLDLIGTRAAAVFDSGTGRIKAGYVNSIPPAASALLRSRGLVRIDGSTVTLSAPARIAMLALAYRPAPWGYTVPAAVLAEFVSLAKAA